MKDIKKVVAFTRQTLRCIDMWLLMAAGPFVSSQGWPSVSQLCYTIGSGLTNQQAIVQLRDGFSQVPCHARSTPL